jgi:ankyrin repeat protein
MYHPLHLAIHYNKVDCIDYLLSINVNVNVKDCNGIMPLHVVISNNNIKYTTLLLNDINKNIQDNYRNTLLSLAILKQNEEIVKLSLDNKCDVNISNGVSLFNLSCIVGNINIIKLLLNN